MSPLLRHKLRVAIGLTLGICLPYFALQQLQIAPPRSLPVTPVDRWVTFDPRWIWPYLSLGLLVPLAPLTARRHAELRGYAWGLASLCLPCFALFALLPVAGPRPESTAGLGAAYAWLVSVDEVWNSFPSLHAGLATFSAGFLRDRLGELPTRQQRALKPALALWGVAILYATLATRQHWFLDLPAGALLGALGWCVARRVQGAAPVPATAGEGADTSGAAA